MYFKEPIIASSIDYIGYLAPIPVYSRVFDDDILHEDLYNFGFNFLDSKQKQMGQELPYRYDNDRQKDYKNFESKETWVESSNNTPIGSRYFVEPNNFLNIKNDNILKIRNTIVEEFSYLIQSIYNRPPIDPTITESWIQYYDPYAGRGHNKHNHNRWNPDEETKISYSGGYYLSDGLPIKDHPYSGVFTFHIRGFNYYIRPKKGLLLMWPSDIIHSVNPFYGKKHRCVINYNIQCK